MLVQRSERWNRRRQALVPSPVRAHSVGGAGAETFSIFEQSVNVFYNENLTQPQNASTSGS